MTIGLDFWVVDFWDGAAELGSWSWVSVCGGGVPGGGVPVPPGVHGGKQKAVSNIQTSIVNSSIAGVEVTKFSNLSFGQVPKKISLSDYFSTFPLEI